ncbi:MAG: quinolinate synthase NadA [Candidatus Omnitrophica bacterium]|nr:quinolinate synthase NadA [Candidatus Omnitrophota bacterium]
MKQNNLEKKIRKLKEKRRAIILAHNYQLPEVQDIADFLGDSLELSKKAAQVDAKVIVFCGVHFMAETASILCPDKKVIMPDITAGCPMAKMITAKKLRRLKTTYPEATVVGYVNTSAEVKAELDYCCTSTNALAVMEALRDRSQIIFIPDKYLAHYVSQKIHKKLIVWDGYCPTHIKILPQDIKREKKLHPKSEIIVHPECLPEVIEMADAVLSTSKMCQYVKSSKAKEFIVATEVGIIYRLKKENPNKEFYPATERAICPNMKKITQEKILWALEELKEEVKVKEEIRIRAIRPIENMFKVI